ncbi:MAG: lysozyme inhibitor LprI family protein [Azoarcus sp.]|jgi:hypothetical protein|nr:lysozyme inhibitor LprI family protein [Azoarcus sp.]
MPHNVRNSSIALLFISFTFTSNAPAQAFPAGPTGCWPSVKEYVASVYGEEAPKSELQVESLDGDKKGIYTLITDRTPASNPPRLILRKNRDGKQCVIFSIQNAEQLKYTINKKGNLFGDITASVRAIGNSPEGIVIFKLNNKGEYLADECWQVFHTGKRAGNRIKVHCDRLDEFNAFDCSKAKSIVEKTICQDSQLATLDATLNLNYESVKSDSHGQINQLIADQLLWLKHRDACKTSGCISKIYYHRIDELCSKYGDVPTCTKSTEIQFPE